MLAADPALAQSAIVALAAEDAADEYRALGCAVELWGWVELVRVRATAENARRVLQTHTRGVQFARQRLRALAPAAVLTNSENVWFGGMAARSLGIPHLQVFHALTLEHHWGNRPALIRRYLNVLGLWNARFVGVSETVGAMLARNGVPSAKIAVVPNGVNLAAVRAASECPLPAEVVARLAGRSPLLVTLGRISAVKGHDLLVETAAQLKPRFPDLVWLVCGAVLSSAGVEDTDTFVAELEQNIAAHGLEQNVIFLGEIDYAPALLKRASVYVQPSRTESFCRAVVEAAACDTPVAAFAAGALPEVVNGGGLLAPPKDVLALADAIARLATDPALRAEQVTRAREHIRRYTAPQSAAALRAVLETVTHGNQAHGT